VAARAIIPPAVVPHLRRFGLSGAIALAVVAVMLAGLNPVSLITGEYSEPPAPTVLTGAPAEGAPQEELFAYANLVSRDHDAYWRRAFRQAAVPYASPKFIVVYSNREFGCGVAGAELGTFYCRQERTIYSDLSAYEALEEQYGTSAHWAQAAAISVAFGNHVQYLVDHFVNFGIEPNMPKAPVGDTPELVLAGQRLGMQAWCYAGIWVKTAGLPNLLKEAEYVRAVDAAMAVGPARERALGQGIYKALPPPTIADRDRWFAQGYEVPAAGTCKMSQITGDG
jgi:predicted metalloprotease